ncbi:MAG TPA: hypothetical protein VKP11_12130, partial [Frankiaceae bacterium]|nr:hypothetical protein [Frankiaceae bacterium]
PAAGPALLPRPSPAAQQRGGLARLLRLTAADRTALRRAYVEAYPCGGTGATGRDPRPEDVVIPKGTVFYGEVAGPDPGADTFWAVGPVYVKGPHGDPDRAVPQVWKRAGGGPWVYAGAGPAGGCAQVPALLRALWERSPCPP